MTPRTLAEHTPTPWEARADEAITTKAVVLSLVNQRPIANCATQGFWKADQSATDEANAALIVRAVNNHEALVAALKLAAFNLQRFGKHDGYAHCIDGGDFVACSCGLQDARRTIAAALAAAEGE